MIHGSLTAEQLTMVPRFVAAASARSARNDLRRSRLLRFRFKSAAVFSSRSVAQRSLPVSARHAKVARSARTTSRSLLETVEDAVRAVGNPELPAHEVGLAILGPLRKLDEVAYLRFASVYRSFESLEDFEAEVALLRMERES